MLEKPSVITGIGEGNGNPGRVSVLHTLAYFDIFNYPLTSTEIRQYLRHPAPEPMVGEWLDSLVKDRKVFHHLGFYSLQENPLLVHRRLTGNARAGLLLAKAAGIGRFLQGFPYVRAVGVSGSLSKNFADEKADIDFFIITKANRLWIARTLMHLFKKLTFLTGRQHYYCMNYYLDETRLSLPDRNIFTATEIKTLLPVGGEKTMQEFFLANQWADQWLPACAFRKQERPDKKSSFVKRSTEWFLSGRIGNLLENFLHRVTKNRWEQKQNAGKRNTKGVRMGLVSGRHFAKSNPGDFQEKVLERYAQKLDWLESITRPKKTIVSVK